MSYPSAVFASGAAGYAVAERRGEFPPAAESALRELGRHFQWSSVPRRPVGPCYAVWPGCGGVLAATLRDAGHDRHDRPHTLRIEAAWLPPGAAAAELAAALGVGDERLRDAIAAKPGQRVLYAPHGDYVAAGFATVVSDAAGTAPAPLAPALRGEGPGVRGAADLVANDGSHPPAGSLTPGPSPPKRGRGEQDRGAAFATPQRWWGALAIACVLAVIAAQAWHAQSLRDAARAAAAEAERVRHRAAEERRERIAAEAAELERQERAIQDRKRELLKQRDRD